MKWLLKSLGFLEETVGLMEEARDQIQAGVSCYKATKTLRGIKQAAEHGKLLDELLELADEGGEE